MLVAIQRLTFVDVKYIKSIQLTYNKILKKNLVCEKMSLCTRHGIVEQINYHPL